MAQLLLQHVDQLRHLSLSVYSKASRPLHQTGSSQTPGAQVSQPQTLSPADGLADPGAGNQAGLDRQGSTSDFWVFNLLDRSQKPRGRENFKRKDVIPRAEQRRTAGYLRGERGGKNMHLVILHDHGQQFWPGCKVSQRLGSEEVQATAKAPFQKVWF